MSLSARLLPLSLLLSACRGPAPELAAAASEAPPARKRLTLEQTLGLGEKVDFAGELVRYSWSEDGLFLVREEKGGKVRVDPLTGAESALPKAGEPEEKRPEEKETAEKETAEEETAEEADEPFLRALAAAGVEERLRRKARVLQTSPEGARLLEVGAELFWVQGDLARVLAGTDEGELELEEASPDARHRAFVQANDLVLLDLSRGTRAEVTRDGSPDVFNGKLDWVYQEELYGRGKFKAFWWSPDSARVAFLRLDEAQVFDFTVVDHIEKDHFRVKPEVTRYPKVGDPNPVASVGIVDAAAPESVRWLDLSAHAAEEPLVVRVDWAPGGELFVMLQDRVQTWLELVVVDPATGATRTLLRESAQGWVDRPEDLRWLPDGSFLWLSDRSGQRHLYRYRLDGTLVGTLTQGDWSVREVEDVDEARGLVWFTATRDGAVDQNLYRVGLDGAGLVRLTQGRGQHAPRWNAQRTFFLDRVSSLAEPARLRLCDGEGRVLRELGRAEAPDLERYATSRFELHEVPARDGFALDVALLKPVDFDPARRYPIWLPTYSGPDAPSVSNAWSSSSWYQFLAQNGVMVLQVNVRSASGKGPLATRTCYRQLGIQELHDLEDALAWACATQGGDPERVGITGGSYGGFMTAFALTHSDRFALGIAASGVYDWRMYDTIYTERYMSTPALNPEGYARTSVVEAAASLSGHLVITHGEMDDNVHLQNAIQLVYALQKAGKDFELMLYPQSRHGISDRDLRAFDRRLTWRLIQEHLLGVPGGT